MRMTSGLLALFLLFLTHTAAAGTPGQIAGSWRLAAEGNEATLYLTWEKSGANLLSLVVPLSNTDRARFERSRQSSVAIRITSSAGAFDLDGFLKKNEAMGAFVFRPEKHEPAAPDQAMFLLAATDLTTKVVSELHKAEIVSPVAGGSPRGFGGSCGCERRPASLHFSQASVAGAARSAWMQGARRERDERVLDRTSRSATERNAADRPIPAPAAGGL